MGKLGWLPAQCGAGKAAEMGRASRAGAVQSSEGEKMVRSQV